MCNYRPPTKLREGNVFSRVCLSVCLSVQEVPVQGPNLSHLGIFELVHYEAQTFGKRAVGIRLKCLLVTTAAVTLTDAVPQPPRFTLPADTEYIGGKSGCHDADADSAVPRLPVDRQTQEQYKQTQQAGG